RKVPYRFRFLLIYGGLAGVVGAAIAGVVLLAGTGSGPGSSGWSTWKPNSAGAAGIRQIVQHVSDKYKLDNGKQLLDVIAKAPAVQDVPIHAVAVRGTGGHPDQISLIDAGNSLMFVLCGLGQSCSIATGAPTIARGRLVRREALELSLYTFKYIPNVKYIVAFMPPKRGAQPQYVVYFSKTDLSQQLREPLERTLGPKTPVADTITPKESVTIDRLTGSHEYQFQLQQAQQGDAILVLSAV
ncbi:MAG TPA: hypothetical protein VJ814_08630, partial [Gaiellaceae bacterium]|nr:hypothetical protein [Gaiellaceae bacterium]